MQYRWLGNLGMLGSLALALTACGASDQPNLLDSLGGLASGGLDSGATGSGDGGGATATSGTTTGTTSGATTGTSDDGGSTSDDAGSMPDDQCGAIKQTADVQRAPVDVVIALDSSGSMTDEICQVSTNLEAFADGVGPDTRVTAVYNIGIDLVFQFQLLCMKNDPFAGTALAMDPNRYLRVDTKVDSHNALQQLLDHYGDYSSFLRDGSPTHFIVVSDDTSSVAAADFKSQMEAKLGHGFYFHAIVATGGSCSGSGVGQQYVDLANQTGGLSLPICQSDWSSLFNKLQDAVVASAPLPCSFDIPEPPPGQAFSPDKVSVSFTPPGGTETVYPKASSADVCGDKVGWHFDDETTPTSIEFCPAACMQVKEGGNLGIAFGCEPPVLN